MWKPRRALIPPPVYLVAILALYCNPGTSASTQPASHSKKILYINSYDAEMNWVRNIRRQIDHWFPPEQYQVIQVDLYAKIFDAEEAGEHAVNLTTYLELFARLLADKYKREPIEAVFVSDDPAFRLILAHKPKIFANDPLVVFCGVNQREDLTAETRRKLRITGAFEAPAAVETLRLMLDVHGKPGKLLSVCDNTSTGRAWSRRIRDAATSVGLEVEEAKTETLAGLSQSIQGLAPYENPVVILGAVYHTDDQQVSGYGPTTQAIIREIRALEGSRKSKIPVYSMLEMQVNEGAWGGRCMTGSEIGQQMAQQAYSVLRDQALLEATFAKPVPDSPGGDLHFNYNAIGNPQTAKKLYDHIREVPKKPAFAYNLGDKPPLIPRQVQTVLLYFATIILVYGMFVAFLFFLTLWHPNALLRYALFLERFGGLKLPLSKFYPILPDIPLSPAFLQRFLLPRYVVARRPLIDCCVAAFYDPVVSAFAIHPCVSRARQSLVLDTKLGLEDENGSGKRVRDLNSWNAPELRSFIEDRASILYISGRGGTGKSTLAITLCERAVHASDGKLLPLIIDAPLDVISVPDSFVNALRLLVEKVSGQHIAGSVLHALIRRRRLFLIFEGLSEMSVDFQKRVLDLLLNRERPEFLNGCIINSRRPLVDLPTNTKDIVRINTLPFQGSTLYRFCSEYIRQSPHFGDLKEATPQVADWEDDDHVANVLAAKVVAEQFSRRETVEAGVFFTKLVIDRWIAMDFDALGSLNNLGRSYLRELWDDRLEIEVAPLINAFCDLAWAVIAIDDLFYVREFDRDFAFKVFDEDGAKFLEEFENSGLIERTRYHFGEGLRFGEDPLAEYLAPAGMIRTLGRYYDMVELGGRIDKLMANSPDLRRNQIRGFVLSLYDYWRHSNDPNVEKPDLTDDWRERLRNLEIVVRH